MLVGSMLCQPVSAYAASYYATVSAGSVVELPTNVTIGSNYLSESEVDKLYQEDRNRATSMNTDTSSGVGKLIETLFPGTIGSNGSTGIDSSQTGTVTTQKKTLTAEEFEKLVSWYKSKATEEYEKYKEEIEQTTNTGDKQDAQEILEAAEKAMNGIDPYTGKTYNSPSEKTAYDEIKDLVNKSGGGIDDLYNTFLNYIDDPFSTLPDFDMSDQYSSALDITINDMIYNIGKSYIEKQVNELLEKGSRYWQLVNHTKIDESDCADDYFDVENYENVNNDITDIKYICAKCGKTYSFNTYCDCGKVLYCPYYDKFDGSLFNLDYTNYKFTHFDENGNASGYCDIGKLGALIPSQSFSCKICGTQLSTANMSNFYLADNGIIFCEKCRDHEEQAYEDLKNKPELVNYKKKEFEPLFQTYAISGLYNESNNGASALENILDSIEDETEQKEAEALIKLYKNYEVGDRSIESALDALKEYADSISDSDKILGSQVSLIQSQITIFENVMNSNFSQESMLSAITSYAQLLQSTEGYGEDYSYSVQLMAAYFDSGMDIDSAIDTMYDYYKKRIEFFESKEDTWSLIPYKRIGSEEDQIDPDFFTGDTVNLDINTSATSISDITCKCSICHEDYGYGSHCKCGKTLYNDLYEPEEISFKSTGDAVDSVGNSIYCISCQKLMSSSNINSFYITPSKNTSGSTWYICSDCRNTNEGHFEDEEKLQPVLQSAAIDGLYQDSFVDYLKEQYAPLGDLSSFLDTFSYSYPNISDNILNDSYILKKANEIYKKIKEYSSKKNKLPDNLNSKLSGNATETESEPHVWTDEEKKDFRDAIEEVFNKGIPDSNYYNDDTTKLKDTVDYEENKNKIFAEWIADRTLWTEEQENLYKKFCEEFENNKTLDEMVDKGIFGNDKTTEEVLSNIRKYIANFTTITDNITVTATIDTGEVSDSTLKKKFDVQGTMDIGVTTESGKVAKNTITVDYSTPVWWIPTEQGIYSINRTVRYYNITWDIVTATSLIRLEVELPNGTTELLAQTEVVRIVEDRCGLNSSSVQNVSMDPLYVKVTPGAINTDILDFFDTERIK